MDFSFQLGYHLLEEAPQREWRNHPCPPDRFPCPHCAPTGSSKRFATNGCVIHQVTQWFLRRAALTWGTYNTESLSGWVCSRDPLACLTGARIFSPAHISRGAEHQGRSCAVFFFFSHYVGHSVDIFNNYSIPAHNSWLHPL